MIDLRHSGCCEHQALDCLPPCCRFSMLLTAASPVCGKPLVRLWERCGYGPIPIDTFLVGWTSIYQLFWGSLGTRVLTHPQTLRKMYDTEMVMVGFRRGTGTTMDMPSHREQRTALATRACDAVFRRQFHPQVGRIQEEKGRDWEPSCLHLLILKYLYCSCKMFKRRWVHVEVWMSEKSYHPSKHTPTHTHPHTHIHTHTHNI